MALKRVHGTEVGRKKLYDDEGKITLRLPADHKGAAEKAADEAKRSLNFWIAEAVEARLKAEGRLPREKKGGR